MVWPAIAAGAAVVGAGAEYFGKKKANKAMEKAAKRQAAMAYATRTEEMRRVGRQQRRTLGENMARIGASNVQFSGSPMAALRDMQSEFAADMAWRTKARQMEYEAIKAGGKYDMTGDAIGGIADIAGIAAKFYTGGFG